MDPTRCTPPWGVNPDPTDKSILWAGDHRSERVWLDQTLGCFNLRNQHTVKYDGRYQDRLEGIGFASIELISKINLDAALIIAIVERWRPETSTFHFPTGECTITLQDVEMLLGLIVKGLPVTIKTDKSEENAVQKICEACLGLNPGRGSLQGNRLNMKWLRNTFNYLPEDAEETDVEKFTLAYILSLIGGVLFPNRSGAYVNCNYLWILQNWHLACMYSWGSAVLSNTFHEMGRTVLGYGSTGGSTCGDLAGCYILIQLWAWQRLPSIAPIPVDPYIPSSVFGLSWTNLSQEAPQMHVRDHRRYLDTTNDFLWNPYMLEESQFDYIWLCVTPLICFHSVAWHHPDRVMRQFNFSQHIPTVMETKNEAVTLLKKDNRAQEDDWPKHHAMYIRYWEDSEAHGISGDPIPTHDMHYHAPYLAWYRRITQRFLTYDAAQRETMIDIVEHARQLTRPGVALHASAVQSLDGLLKNCMLVGDGEAREIGDSILDEAPHREGYPVYPDYVPPLQQERIQQKRRARARSNEDHEQQPQIPEPLQVSSSRRGSTSQNRESTPQPSPHHETATSEYHAGSQRHSQHETPFPTSQFGSPSRSGLGGLGFAQFGSPHSQGMGGFAVFGSPTVQQESHQAALRQSSTIDFDDDDSPDSPEQHLDRRGRGRGKKVVDEGGNQRNFSLRPRANIPPTLCGTAGRHPLRDGHHP